MTRKTLLTLTFQPQLVSVDKNQHDTSSFYLPLKLSRHLSRAPLTDMGDYDWTLPEPPTPPEPIPEGVLVDARTGQMMAHMPELQCVGGYDTALAAYNVWCTELGVSSSTSLPGLINDDDSSAIVNIGFSALIGGTTNLVSVSTEGGFCIYRNIASTISGTDMRPIQLAPDNTEQFVINRFYVNTNNSPALMILAKVPGADTRSENARWQKTADTAIFYVEYRQYNSFTNMVKMALKLKAGGHFEVVTSEASGDNLVKLQFMTFNESSTGTHLALSGFGGFTAGLPGNVTSVYATEPVSACIPAEPEPEPEPGDIHFATYPSSPRMSAYDIGTKTLITPIGSIPTADSQVMEGAPWILRYNPIERTIAMARFDATSARVEFWSIDTWTVVRSIELPGKPEAIEYNHDFSRLAIGHQRAPHYQVIDTSTWEPIANMPTVNVAWAWNAVMDIDWDHTREYDLVLGYHAGGSDSGVMFIVTNPDNAANRSVGEFWKFVAPARRVESLAFIPNTPLVAVGHLNDPDLPMRFIDVNTRQLAPIYAPPNLRALNVSIINHVDVLPDGSKLIVQFGSGSGPMLFVYDLTTSTWTDGLIVGTLWDHGFGGIFRVSPDGSYIAYPNNMIIDTSTWERIDHPHLGSLIPGFGSSGQIEIIKRNEWDNVPQFESTDIPFQA